LTKFVIHQIIRFNSVKCKVIRFQCYRYRSIYCFVSSRKSLYYASQDLGTVLRGITCRTSFQVVLSSIAAIYQGVFSNKWCALMMIRSSSFKTNSSLDPYNGVTTCISTYGVCVASFSKITIF
jgi:hypothetical protein